MSHFVTTTPAEPDDGDLSPRWIYLAPMESKVMSLDTSVANSVVISSTGNVTISGPVGGTSPTPPPPVWWTNLP